MENMLLMMKSIVKEDLNGQVLPMVKWNSIKTRFDQKLALFNSSRLKLQLREEVFGLDTDGKPHHYYGVISDIVQDIGLALLEIKHMDKFAFRYEETCPRRWGNL
jgi:hypothetical protein